jgi:catechol 2,3-dioxygenase-like lactoylglutathione lyase family enzyme
MTDTAITGISAITLATHDMARACGFYEKLGFALKFGGPESAFTSYYAGSGFLNLIAAEPDQSVHWWGRVIFYVEDVDAFLANALAQGLAPHFQPEDAPWGERYFHLTDPDGHELSFARPL